MKAGRAKPVRPGLSDPPTGDEIVAVGVWLYGNEENWRPRMADDLQVSLGAISHWINGRRKMQGAARRLLLTLVDTKRVDP